MSKLVLFIKNVLSRFTVKSNMLRMLIGCAIFFIALFGYKIFGKIMMNKYFDTMTDTTVTVSTATVEKMNWITTLNSVGSVQAINNVDVTTESSGVVDEIKFDSGDHVIAGDTLVLINAKTDIARLLALKTDLKLAEKNLVRAQELIKANNISKAEFDLKQSEAEKAAAQVAVQQALVDQKIVRAPFSGDLGIRKINIGEYISPGSPIVSLQSLNPIYVNFSLPEQDLYKLKLGLEVDAKVSAFKDEFFLGKITAIEPGADPATRNFNIQARFENNDLKLRSGMFAEVTIKLPEIEQVSVIPRTAVSYNPYGNSVYIVSESKNNNDKKEFTVKRKFIKLGHERGEMVSVLDGLSEGDVIVTSGLLKLRNNSKISINNTVIPNLEPSS